MLKVMIVGRRKPGTTLAEHRHHIRHVHGERVLRYVASEPQNAPRRYVQNAVFDGQFRSTPVAGVPFDPFTLNRDFVTQIWMPDFAALARSRQTAFYRDHLQGDEDNFVDQASVVFLPVQEHHAGGAQQHDAVPPGGCKLFGFVQRTPGTAADDFVRSWRAGAPALAAATGLQRHVHNQVVGKPGDAMAADAIDEFWLGSEAEAHALLAAWRAWTQEALVRTGLATGSGSFALLATEAVLHAGVPG